MTEREAGEGGSLSVDDRDTEGGGERERENPQDVSAGSRGGGGGGGELPDWMTGWAQQCLDGAWARF